MSPVNKKKILIGMSLIMVALFGALTVFYIQVVKPELEARQKSGQAKLKTQKEKVQQRAQDIKKQETKVQPVAAKPAAPASAPVSPAPAVPDNKQLIEFAKTQYSPEEQKKREGSLWVDRKASKLVITLGGVQGLTVGQKISLYDGNKKIGQVEVEAAYDVISYVRPSGISIDQLSKDYYSVRIE